MMSKRQKQMLVAGIALACCFCVVSCEATQNGQAIIPLIAYGIIIAVSFVGGYIVSEMMHESDQEKIDALMSASINNYVNGFKSVFAGDMAYAKAQTVIETNSYNATLNYMTNMAEWRAGELYKVQKASGANLAYDVEYVFNGEAVAGYESALVASRYAYYTGAFKSLEGIPESFTGDLYGNLNFNAFNGAGYHITMSDTENTGAYWQSLPMILAGSTNQVYLAPNQTVYAIKTGGVIGADTILLKNGANETVGSYPASIDAMGQIVPIEIADNLSPYTSFYFDNTNYAYFSVWIPALSNGATIYTNGAICYLESGGVDRAIYLFAVNPTDSSNAGYIGLMGNDGSWKFNYNTAVSGGASLQTEPGRLDIVSNAVYGSIYVPMAMSDGFAMGAYYDRLDYINGIANNYALTYYQTLVSTNADPNATNFIPKPSALFPNMDVANYTTDQLQALLWTYYNQMASYYKDHTGTLDLNNVSYSPESLSLYVRGTLYDKNGNVLYGNTTIWTPYITTTSQTIYKGMNWFNNSVIAVKWGTGNTIADFLAGSHTASDMSYIEPSIGSYANIEEIYFNNQSVDSKALTVASYQSLVPETGMNPPGGSGINLGTMDYILLFAGVACLLVGGLLMGTSMKAIGFIVAVVGVGVLGYWMIGYLDINITDLFGGLFQINYWRW